MGVENHSQRETVRRIALHTLGIADLTTHGSDRRDFKQIHVGLLASALREAYTAGIADAMGLSDGSKDQPIQHCASEEQGATDMKHAFNVYESFRAEYDWEDNTFVDLLLDFVDKCGQAKALNEYFKLAARERGDDLYRDEPVQGAIGKRAEA